MAKRKKACSCQKRKHHRSAHVGGFLPKGFKFNMNAAQDLLFAALGGGAVRAVNAALVDKDWATKNPYLVIGGKAALVLLASSQGGVAHAMAMGGAGAIGIDVGEQVIHKVYENTALPVNGPSFLRSLRGLPKPLKVELNQVSGNYYGPSMSEKHYVGNVNESQFNETHVGGALVQ